MSSFWELLRESIIVQSLITLMFVGAIVYLYITGHEPPQSLLSLTQIVVGYWIGTKVQHGLEGLRSKRS